jgi:hypothetical protein
LNLIIGRAYAQPAQFASVLAGVFRAVNAFALFIASVIVAPFPASISHHLK